MANSPHGHTDKVMSYGYLSDIMSTFVPIWFLLNSTAVENEVSKPTKSFFSRAMLTAKWNGWLAAKKIGYRMDVLLRVAVSDGDAITY